MYICIYIHMYIYICIYPAACGKPATMPGSIDRSIDLLLERLSSCTGLWDALWHLEGHFGIHFSIILVVLGSVLASLGSPGSKGGRVEKGAEKVVRGSFVGPPPGPPLEAKSANNRKTFVPRSTLKNIVRKMLHKRSPRTPSNHENWSCVCTNPFV